MGGKRNSGEPKLPERWAFKHGAYYYRPRETEKAAFDGKSWFRLGDKYPDALRVFADRLDLQMGDTVADCLDRYILEALPLLAKNTQTTYKPALNRLRAGLGRNSIQAVTPQMAYQYMDAVRKAHSMSVANLDMRVLKTLVDLAVRWGVCKANGLRGNVKEFGVRDGLGGARERYVHDWELAEWLKVASLQQAAFAALVMLLGTRKSDILRLTEADIDDAEGLLMVRNSKSGKMQPFIITPALRAAIGLARASRPKPSQYLICNSKGQCYVDQTDRSSNFDAKWDRSMQIALAETDLKEPFTRHDLRAKRGSDETDEKRAQELLGHTNIATTRKHYRRKQIPIMPAE